MSWRDPSIIANTQIDNHQPLTLCQERASWIVALWTISIVSYVQTFVRVLCKYILMIYNTLIFSLVDKFQLHDVIIESDRILR